MAKEAGASIQLDVSDGTSMAAYVVRPPDKGRHPGLMLFQEAFGVNPHIRDVAGRFAREGYLVVAPELFHRTAPGFQGDYANFEACRPHMAALTNEGLDADIQATFDWLKKDPGTRPDSIASVGFCMGGRVSYFANSLLPLRCAVSFYGANIAPGNLGRAPRLHGPMLFFWGGLDKNIGPDQINAVVATLRASQKNYTNVEISDADHGFFNDARKSFNKQAAGHAWGLTLAFLNSHLGS